MIDKSRMGVLMRQSGATIVAQHQISWDNIRLDLQRRTGLERQETNIIADEHSIFLNIQGSALAGEDRLDGKRIAFRPRAEGSLTYVPPRCHWEGWDEGDQDAAYLRISVKDALIDRLYNSNALRGLNPELGFTDLGIQAAARRIAKEIERADSASPYVVEGNVVAIFGHMLRRTSSAALRIARGGLSPAALRRTLKFIDDQLGNSVRLEDMAAVAGISVHHFQHAFRQSIGTAPHKYLDSRRLKRARELLRATDLTMTEIAFQCGFYSPSHFSSRFYSHEGMSPTVYRRLSLQ